MVFISRPIRCKLTGGMMSFVPDSLTYFASFPSYEYLVQMYCLLPTYRRAT